MKKAFVFTVLSYILYSLLFYVIFGRILKGYILIAALCLGQIFLIPVFKEVDYQSGKKIQVKWIWSKKVFFEF